MLTTLTVNVLYDVVSWVDTDSDVSLREAIERSEAIPGADTIEFDPSIVGDSMGVSNTITLTNGQLTINDDLTIVGPGTDSDDPSVFDLAISGNDADRIFDVSGTSLEIRGLKLTAGYATSNNGGAIRSTSSDLTILESEISANRAAISGGGIYADATSNNDILIEDVALYGNHAATLQPGSGGGIWLRVKDNSHAVIRLSTIDSNTVDNSIGGSGGGANVINSADGDPSTIEILDSTVSNNTVGEQAMTTGLGGGGISAGVQQNDGNELLISAREMNHIPS